jgi:hypothetical protein
MSQVLPRISYFTTQQRVFVFVVVFVVVFVSNNSE